MAAQANLYHAFFALVRAGLWEQEVRLAPYGEVDFAAVYRMAKEQAVVGLVAAGLGRVVDREVPQSEVVPFGGDVLQLEQRNLAMNHFIARLFSVFHRNGVSALLVKGQGIAQCYEKPLWRMSGDVDLLFDEANYQRAKRNMLKKARPAEEEDPQRLHLPLYMGPWLVELHGTLHLKFLPRVNRVLSELQEEAFRQEKTRVWNNDGVEVALPAPDQDVLFVFAHILEHFFEFGIGLRQICDWCRLLYTYSHFPPPTPSQEGMRVGNEEGMEEGNLRQPSPPGGGRGRALDIALLEQRLRQMGVLSEWKAFAAFAVETLGMSPERMPLYSPDRKWRRKASRIRELILKGGNFGHNRDTDYLFAPFLKKKAVSLRYMISENIHNMMIFPKDSLHVWRRQTFSGLTRAARGK